MDQLVAWDGTAAEFYRALQAMVDGTFIESDAAVISEVVALAQEYVRDNGLDNS